MRGMFFIPETYTEAATTCLVVAAGNKVNPLIKSGQTVLCEVGFADRKNLLTGTGRDFFCREHNIYAIVRNNIIYSFGRTVIIKRDIAKKITDGGIEIPENRRTQSLEGEIVRLGLSTKPFRVNGLKQGMRVSLQDWQSHMIEITLEDGSFGLIVKETDILYHEY